MGAPKGNQFWVFRSSHGSRPRFRSGQQLWGAACEYFEYTRTNPLLEQKIFVVDKTVKKVNVKKMRAMTLDGLHIFLGISHDTWAAYRKRDGLSAVTKRVDAIIRTQKFEGAAAGLLNPNIIARDLGLRDHTGNEHYGPDKGPIENKWVIEVVEAK